MRILSVKQERYDCGIPLQGIDSVKSALQLFSNGYVSGSRTTTTETARQIKDGMGAMLFLQRFDGTSDRFLSKLLSKMEQGLNERGLFEQSFDYDGQGPFFKTTVSVIRYDKDSPVYILKLHAAYVGKQPEDGLAKHLGVPQGLQWLIINIETAPVEQHFELDFQEILNRLEGPLNLAGSKKKLAGDDVVKAITAFKDFGDSSKTFTLQKADSFDVDMTPDGVDGPFEYKKPGERKMVWVGNGAKLSGPLSKSCEAGRRFSNPKIKILICSNKGTDYNRLPIIAPEVKAQVEALADGISKAFQV